MERISSNCFADTIFGRPNVFCKLGFGVCKRSNDFKVVRIHYVKDEESRLLGNVAPEVEVYSSSADSWKRIKANVKCIANNSSVSCNGSIHWLARKKNGFYCDAILSFDIESESFCEIELPLNEHFHFDDGTLLVFEGLLAIFKNISSCREFNKCYELWVMDKYKVAESWTKRYILKTRDPVITAFGFTKSGILVMQMLGYMLASWEPKSNILNPLDINVLGHHVDTAFLEFNFI